MTNLVINVKLADWTAKADCLTLVLHDAPFGRQHTYRRVSVGIEMLVSGGQRRKWDWEPYFVEPAIVQMLETFVFDHPVLRHLAPHYGIYLPDSLLECNR